MLPHLRPCIHKEDADNNDNDAEGEGYKDDGGDNKGGGSRDRGRGEGEEGRCSTRSKISPFFCVCVLIECCFLAVFYIFYF